MSLASATRSELTKQFTTSIWWILAIVLLAYVGATVAGLGAILGLAATGRLPGDDAPPIAPDGIAATLYSGATSVGYVFPLLIGTLLVTVEFRHKTLTPTFLAVPRRATVLWAKLGAGVVIGLLFGVVGLVSSVGVGAGILAAFGLEHDLAQADTWTLMGRMLIAYVLWVFIGIGVGALVRNQVGAIVGVLVFTQFIEPIARLGGAFVDQLATVVNYLPGAASDALVGHSLLTLGAPAGNPLEWWVGGLVLLGYAVVLLILGYLSSWRRDVA